MSARRSLLIAVLLAVLALAGCGGGLNHGHVTAKHYDPAHTTTMIIPLAIYCGKGCVSFVPIVWLVRVPEHYVLELRACEGKPKKCRTGHAYTSQETYDGTKVGSYYKVAHGEGHPPPVKKLHTK